MTPEELLAACREAWPETEASAWEAGDAPLAERTVGGRGGWYVAVGVLGDGRVGGRCEALGARAAFGPVHAPATPAGVREVVTALRAWCRAEAARLAAEVDPPEPDCPASCEHGRCLLSAGGHEHHVTLGADRHTWHWLDGQPPTSPTFRRNN